jgi:hypothetical protein
VRVRNIDLLDAGAENLLCHFLNVVGQKLQVDRIQEVVFG